jgi:hypothetical protein
VLVVRRQCIRIVKRARLVAEVDARPPAATGPTAAAPESFRRSGG